MTFRAEALSRQHGPLAASRLATGTRIKVVGKYVTFDDRHRPHRHPDYQYACPSPAQRSIHSFTLGDIDFEFSSAA